MVAGYYVWDTLERRLDSHFHSHFHSISSEENATTMRVNASVGVRQIDPLPAEEEDGYGSEDTFSLSADTDQKILIFTGPLVDAKW